MPRLVYHFFHANIVHASINGWCLMSLAFIYNISAYELFLAYAIASSYPIDFFCSVFGDEIAAMPTVGMSGICFAIMGQVAFRVVRKLYYNSCVCAIIAVGLFFPNANTLLHLYCYVIGLVPGFLNSPMPHAE